MTVLVPAGLLGAGTGAALGLVGGGGSILAGRVAGRLPERALRYGFAALVLAVGTFVAAQAALGDNPAPS